jgi:hypothetical protein
MLKTREELICVVGMFLAGERKEFEKLVNFIRERLVLDGLVECFFPWAFFFFYFYFFICDKAWP